VLCLSNVLIREIEHANDDEEQTDYHRYETILIFLKLMHLLILLHSSHTFANMLYVRGYLIDFLPC
jgi:hypothetical protein